MLNEHEKSEMRTQYRDAADKRKQIGILSELYDCSKEEVLDALGLADKGASAGANTKHETAGKHNPRKSYEQAVKNDVAKAVLVEGLSANQAAEKFGVPLGNVSRWVRKAKEKQAEFLKEAEKTEKECAAKAALPALKKAGAPTDENKVFAQKVLAEMREGIDGLHAFIDNFAGVDILNDDERATLDRILFTASGFAEGVQAGLELARRN